MEAASRVTLLTLFNLLTLLALFILFKLLYNANTVAYLYFFVRGGNNAIGKFN